MLFKGKELSGKLCGRGSVHKEDSLEPTSPKSEMLHTWGMHLGGAPGRRSFKFGVWEPEDSRTKMLSGDSWAGGGTRAGALMDDTDSSVRPTERSGRGVKPKRVTQGSQGAVFNICKVVIFEPFLWL